MTGLNKIIDQIQAEAELSANQIIEEASQTVREILDQAEQESQAQVKSVAEKARVDLQNYRERIKSSADFQRRTALLKAKQEILSEMIEKAYQTLKNEDNEGYYEFIEKIIKKSALPKDGQIYFSEKDLSRLPEGFENKISEAAAANSGSLTLVREPKDIEDGFVLVYGGIEENCTFRALFDAKKEQLQDRANAVVFS